MEFRLRRIPGEFAECGYVGYIGYAPNNGSKNNDLHELKHNRREDATGYVGYVSRWNKPAIPPLVAVAYSSGPSDRASDGSMMGIPSRTG
jgi:hypothetical protein